MELTGGVGNFRQMGRLIQAGVGRLAPEFAPCRGIENRHTHLWRSAGIFKVVELMIGCALLLIMHSIPYQNDSHVILCFFGVRSLLTRTKDGKPGLGIES
jgi:hypothetical protein